MWSLGLVVHTTVIDFGKPSSLSIKSDCIFKSLEAIDSRVVAVEMQDGARMFGWLLDGEPVAGAGVKSRWYVVGDCVLVGFASRDRGAGGRATRPFEHNERHRVADQ
jgi:hypothetical protein